MDEYLHFENAIFCSSNCNFFKFSAHNLPTFAIIILHKTIGHQIQCSVFGISLSFPKFNVLFKFNYITPGFFGGGLIQGRSFPFQKLVPKRRVSFNTCARANIIRILQ